MDSRELLKQFKAAEWDGPAEVEAFVHEAGAVPGDDIQRLLALLQTRGLPGDFSDQRKRYVAFAKIADKSADKELFHPYVRVLKSNDGPLAAVVAPLIPKVNNVAGHGELCGVLKMPDPQIRRLAAYALKQIGGTTVFRTLSDMLGESNFPGRTEAMDIVVAIGRQHAIPALRNVLEVGGPNDKVQALAYLSNPEIMAKDVPAAVEAISVALKDTTEKVALQAIAAFTAHASEDEFFAHIGPALDSSNLATVKAAVDALKKFSSPRALDALDRKLKMGPNAIRLQVLASLEAIGNDSVIPVVVQALNHKKIDVRTRAGEVLTNLALQGKVDLARTILWLLRSRDVNVRRMAVDIAKKVGDPTGELAPKLLRFLRDEDWWVRERVMDALVVMAGKQLTRHLVAYLQDPSDVVRRYAVDALERIRDRDAVGALVRAAQGDTDWWVRERAIEALGAIKHEKTMPYILDIMAREPELQRVCVDAVLRMAEPPIPAELDASVRAAAPHVAALLGSPDVEMRLLVLQTLGALDDVNQAQAVAALAQEPDHRVRNAVRELMTRWNLATQTNLTAAGQKSLSVLDRLLVALAQNEGDDLLLAGGQTPYMKKIGKVVPLAKAVFTPEQVKALLLPNLTGVQIQDLEKLRDVDFSYEVKAEGLRFRANVFYQRTGLSAVFRIIKNKIPVIEELGLPPVAHKFGELKNGLVLVGGPTGSGKSTTLAGIIDHINRTSARHIITLEDPIEVVHAQQKCLINQREIGTHTHSFDNALRATLREDPDVILVGEMRDLATIGFALTAAETGHLVFGTLHTVSVDTSVDRLINAFPSGQQPQVRSMLADTLRSVMCQYLLKRKDGLGRVLAVEVMVNNDAIANLIRKGKTFQIPSVVATGKDQGMQAMDGDLERLLKEGRITAEDAYMKAANKKNFEGYVDGAKKDAAKPGAPAAGGAAPAAAGPAAGPTTGRTVAIG